MECTIVMDLLPYIKNTSRHVLPTNHLRTDLQLRPSKTKYYQSTKAEIKSERENTLLAIQSNEPPRNTRIQIGDGNSKEI